MMMKKFFVALLVIFSVLFVQNVYAIEETTSTDVTSNVVFADNNYNNVTNTQPLQCSSLGKLIKDIEGIFNIFKIVAPILVVIFSTYDFIKAAANKAEEDGKAAFQRLVKRLIFAFLLFFIPSLINFFLGLIDPSYSTCVNITQP